MDSQPIAPRFEEKTQEKEPVKQVQPPKETTVVKEDLVPTGAMSGGKLWGRVIRQLRLEKNIVLWVACQEMDAKLVGNTLKIVANDDAGYQAVVKESNLSILSRTVKSIGDYEIEIVKAGEEKVDSFTSEVEKVKKTFSGVSVKVEE